MRRIVGEAPISFAAINESMRPRVKLAELKERY